MLSARLADLRGWSLVVICGCRHYPVYVPLEPIAVVRGNRVTLGAVLKRLRCKNCGKPPGRVDGVLGDPYASRPWRVRLVP